MKNMKKIFVFLFSLTVLVGCGNKPSTENNDQVSVDLNEVHEAVQDHLGEDYVATMEIEETQLEEVVGLNMEDIDEIIAQQPMMSTHVDTFIAAKAKTDKADSVEKALAEYRTFLIDNSMQYPGNIAKVNASEVVRHGDYVFFIMLGAFDQRDDVTEDEQLTFAENEVTEIKEIINQFFN